MSQLEQAVDTFKAQVEAAELNALSTITGAYVDALTVLLPKVQQLANQVATLEGPLTQSDIVALSQYQAVLSELDSWLTTIGATTSDTASALQIQNAKQGADNALALIQAQLAGVDPATIDALGSFNTVNPEALLQLLGATGDGPLQKLLSANGAGVYDQAVQALLNGLLLGQSPGQIAKDFQKVFGSNLDRALRIARTETLRAYREANRHTLLQNQDVVKGYVRIAAKQKRTCIACLLADGQFYPLDKPLNEHPNGRCALVPVTKYYKPPLQNGSDWFHAQSPEVQREVLGDAKYEQWQDGADLDSFVKLHKSPVWGESLVTS